MVALCPGMTSAPKTYMCMTTLTNQLSYLYFQYRRKILIFKLCLYLHKCLLTVAVSPSAEISDWQA